MRQDIIAIIDHCSPDLERWRAEGALHGLFIAPDLPEEKLQKAIRKYADDIKPEEVIVLNASAFGTGKQGFILTEKVIVGYEDFRRYSFNISDVQTLGVGGMNNGLVVNGELTGSCLSNSPEAADEIIRLLRALCMQLKTGEKLKEPETVVRTAEHLSRHVGNLAFSGYNDSSWRCSCGTTNPMERSVADELCSSCLSSRNRQLIYASPRLVTKALDEEGEITAEDVIAELPWLSLEQVEAVFAGIRSEARGERGCAAGCFVPSLVITIVGIGLLVARPAEWGIPGFVCFIIIAVGIGGLMTAWKMFKGAGE